MYSGRVEIVREEVSARRPFQLEASGAQEAPSDSIRGEIHVPGIPNGRGERQTRKAVLRGAKIPCLLEPYERAHFSFWNEMVAAEVELVARQSNPIVVRPKQEGHVMATPIIVCASLLYGDYPQPLKTRDAVSMAIPEVSKCR